jgi:hypothetical protein
VSTLLEHTPHVVPHVFALQEESSLQFQNQAVAISGASGIKLWKRMTEKLTQKSLHTAMPHRVQECSRPSKWQERWCHRSEWPCQGSAYGQGYLRQHWPAFYGMCSETWCRPISYKQDKCVQLLLVVWITIIDLEYRKWLPLTDWFNNRPRLRICRDRRRSNVVSLPSPPPSWHFRQVLSELISCPEGSSVNSILCPEGPSPKPE